MLIVVSKNSCTVEGKQRDDLDEEHNGIPQLGVILYVRRSMCGVPVPCGPRWLDPKWCCSKWVLSQEVAVSVGLRPNDRIPSDLTQIDRAVFSTPQSIFFHACGQAPQASRHGCA